MDTYLLALGWWNIIGSLVMITFFHEPTGKNVLNKWTKIFKTEFTLNYWAKFWLAWAIGLNIFFGLINIYSVKWNYYEVKNFLIIVGITAYLVFAALAICGRISETSKVNFARKLADSSTCWCSNG